MEDQEPYTRLISAMKQQAKEDKEFMAKVQDTFETLNLHDSITANHVLELAHFLTTCAIDASANPTSELEIDENHGKGINMYQAVGNLYDYIESDQTYNLDSALAWIFREKERRILNELDIKLNAGF